MTRRTAIWALAALLGIVLTAGITWATSQLTSQHIGLASEPLSAGSHLAPPVAAKTALRRSRLAPASTPTVTVRAVTVPSLPTPSRSTQTAPAAPVEVAPPVTAEPAPVPRTSSSGDDGGDHGKSSGEGRETGRSARGRDD